MPYANNKDADQPAHPGSLISTFVVHSLDSIMLEVTGTKFQDPSRSHELSRLVCILPGRKPGRKVFS